MLAKVVFLHVLIFLLKERQTPRVEQFIDLLLYQINEACDVDTEIRDLLISSPPVEGRPCSH